MKKYYAFITLFISVLFAVLLGVTTFNICSWPTDSELAYIPAATHVFMTPYISDLHHSTLIQFKIMHGKEALVVAISIFQHLLNDYEGLFPNILALICATAGSGFLIFLILIRIVNHHAAFLGFILFSTCFWTYQYILQGAHQPLVMFHFLLSTFLLLKFDGRLRFYFTSGLALGLMLFSSPTASIYLPYYLAAYIFQQHSLKGHFPWKNQVLPLTLITLGAIFVIVIFTIPDPVQNFKDFASFLSNSRSSNHFQITEQSLNINLPIRGAGLIWIWKYFILIMPILFGSYLLAILYLAKRSFEDKTPVFLVIMSLSTPLIVELMQVAQFGRNYFSWLLGILFIICYAIHIFFSQEHSKKVKKGALALIFCMVVTHTVFNYKIFLKDVLPSRMATTYMHDWFLTHSQQNNYAYILHPHNINTVNVLNRPGEKNIIHFNRIKSIADAKDGYMLIPVQTGKSIFVNCHSVDFTDDPFLKRLMESGEFHRFVVATFPTMASSRIWPQEEEYCSYLDLIENKISDYDRNRGHAWIVDLKKLHEEWPLVKSLPENKSKL
jgi:predicted outer membrane lipoprotein